MDKLAGVQERTVRVILDFANRTFRKRWTELRWFSLEKWNLKEKNGLFSLFSQPVCNESKLEQSKTRLNRRKNLL